MLESVRPSVWAGLSARLDTRTSVAVRRRCCSRCCVQPGAVTSSVSGLLHDWAHLRKTGPRCLQCGPWVAAV